MSRKEHQSGAKSSRGRKRRTAARVGRLGFETLEMRELLAVDTFQQGAMGYDGAQDTILYSISPNVNFGTETGMSPDQQDANGVRQGLMRFDNIFGPGPDQIPLGSTINSASLTVTVFNDSNSAMQMSFYRMLTGWNEATATWNSFGEIGGVQASEGESSDLPPDGILYDASTGTKSIDVTQSLRHWSSGEANLGWLIESAATNGWDFNTSEAAQSNRPILTVDYTAPGGPGRFEFLNLSPIEAEGTDGNRTAMLSVARVGGSTGAVTVDYAVAAGTATAGADFTAASGTLSFADGETLKMVPVEILGDSLLEGSETVVVTLSGATGGSSVGAGQGVATLTIADDDALINEVLANVTTNIPGFTEGTDETNREYIELIGTPGASLDGYYFVVFEGEEEEGSVGGNGAGIGVADIVVNLTGVSFGSNGLLLIAPTTWAYEGQIAPGTTRVIATALDAVGGGLEDSSQTYALIRSPGGAIVQGTDYDTIGSYENSTQTAEGFGVGVLDQLPAGASVVDSVGVVEGGGGDRDRVLTATGNPGVHVHHPFTTGNSISSDAVSRRAGQTLPNSIGAWFNGDIFDATAQVIRYPLAVPGQMTPASVVNPDGAVLTPGQFNILRNVEFTVTATSVDESAGTVTLTVQRTGDTSAAISVNFSTVNGTASSGADYEAQSGTLEFAADEATKDIVINILTDSTPEGFETFGVNLTAASQPFLITRGTATVTIVDGDVLTASFKDGVGGYNGTTDAYLDGLIPDLEFGFSGSVIVDQERGEGEPGDPVGSDTRPLQGLLKFDGFVGDGPGQVPAGSQVFGAFITLNVVNPSASDAAISFYRMLQNWDESTATWVSPQGSAGGSILNGVTPDGVEATSDPDFVVTNPGQAGLVQIPLNRETVQAWVNGSLSNLGWSIVSDSSDSWAFASSDDFFSQNPILPELTILYNAPTGAGSFGFSTGDYSVNENATAEVIVQRVGGASGAAAVDYSIQAGTGTLADISGPTSGTLNFADGELFKTISIPTVNDNLRERDETLVISLTGAGVDPLRSEATLKIRDVDFVPTSGTVLLNELWINSPGNDGLHEYVELIGTPGVGLGSLFVVVIDGDLGEGEGSTSLVVDLGTFLNGANGLSLVGGENLDYNVASGATKIDAVALAIENLSNDSATYALVYSPSASLATGAFDYDWDNDGSLELPSGAVIVDSIAIRDDGPTDQLYGPGANQILSQLNPNFYVPDAVSRKLGNVSRNSAAAWYHGDLVPEGDDPLVYDALNATGLPSPGAAQTPGAPNAGTPAQSPLVSLTGITPNPDGTVSVNFSGPISQSLAGGGVPGVSITAPDGSAIGGVDFDPIITGFETSTLTLTFTGASIVGGMLPAGDYRLNFSGNALIGNGRAVDAANTLTPEGSSAQIALSVTAAFLEGDYNGDNSVDAADYTVWRDRVGSGTPLPFGDLTPGVVDQNDYDRWKAQFGMTAAPAFAAVAAALAPAESIAEATAFSEPLPVLAAADTDAAFAFFGDDDDAVLPIRPIVQAARGFVAQRRSDLLDAVAKFKASDLDKSDVAELRSAIAELKEAAPESLRTTVRTFIRGLVSRT